MTIQRTHAPRLLDLHGHVEYYPTAELWNAAHHLWEQYMTRAEGSGHAGIAALVLTGFVIEGVCQAEGPEAFGDAWPQMENLPVIEKVQALGKRGGFAVDFGKLPWSEVKAVLKARNELAHPKSSEKHVALKFRTGSSLHPLDAVHAAAAPHWKRLLDYKRAPKISPRIEEALEFLYKSVGKSKWELHQMAVGSYMLG